MKRCILLLSVGLLLVSSFPAQPETPRRPNPLAPSIPLLTPEEEARIDHIINRFILFDTGKLKGAAGKKALQDFQKLGPEAMFPLIRGFNRAAAMEASCPAAVIGKKLLGFLKTTKDRMLLDFARENIGIGINRGRHLGIVRDLRAVCLLRRRNALLGVAMVTPGDPFKGKIVIRPRSKREKTIARVPVDELVRAIEKEEGDAQKELLVALGKRSDGMDGLAHLAAKAKESDIRGMAFDLLIQNIARQPLGIIRSLLQADKKEVRAAAAVVVGDRKLSFIKDLIGLIDDKESEVVQSARKSLYQLTRKDFGPEVFSTQEERTEAAKRWRTWYAQR